MNFLKLFILVAHLPLIYSTKLDNSSNTSHLQLSSRSISNSIIVQTISNALKRTKHFFKRVFNSRSQNDDINSICDEYFGKKWYQPSSELNHLFGTNGHFLCIFETPGDGNCLYIAISGILKYIKDNTKKQLEFPAHSYEGSPELKQKMYNISKGKFSPSNLKKLAALDFIGVDFDNYNNIKQLNKEELINKLKVYKQAYAGSGGDNIKISYYIDCIEKKPLDQKVYKLLYKELSSYGEPLHWGNEADIAAFERLFNIKFIICDDYGALFTVPSDVKNPKYISLLHFNLRHYSIAAIFKPQGELNDIMKTRRLFFNMENIPEFLKKYINTE